MFFWNAMCSVHSMATWTTRHIAPNQAWFEPEYFLALTEDGPSLFNLIGQCFQDVSLTKWNKVIGRQCLDDNDLAKASFKKWTQDYQRQSPGFPKQMSNWFVGLALQRRLHSCWYMNSCNDGHSYLAISTVATSIKKWSYQQRRRRASRSSFWNSRHISTRSETNMTVLPRSPRQRWRK